MTHHSKDVFMFLLLSISLGALSTYVLSRYAPDLPYTVVVFILGNFNCTYKIIET